MILTREKVTVESNIPMSDRKAMSLKVGPEIFGIFTKNLYANPVLSTLSEAGQNSTDSMRRAGKGDQPFTVTLPSYLSPTLVVRDFGVGMSHEFVMGDYCVTGQSSKSDDNNQLGGFGIGKLSCLALSTTYNLSCFSDGKKRVYSVYLNGEGVPEISHLTTVSTEEPNGVEISVPIQSKDIDQFIDAAREAYRFYNPKPTIQGVRDFQFHQNMKSLFGTGWEVDNSIGYPVAVGGVYWYKIDSDNIPNLTPAQSELLNSGMGLVLYFNASEIHPQANRQGLFYNDVTCAAIKKRLVELEVEIKNSVQKEFDKCQNILEAKRLWLTYFDSRGMAYKIGKIFGDMPTLHWNGYEVDDGYFTTLMPDPIDPTKHIPIPGVVLRSYVVSYGRRKETIKEYKDDHRFLAHPDNRVFRNDLDGGRGAKYRIGYALTTGRSTAAYYSVRFKTAQAELEFHRVNHTDASIFESAAAIVVPADAKVVGTDNSKHKIKVFKFIAPWKNPAGRRASHFWEPAEVEIDIEEGGIYTTIHRFKMSGMDNKTLSDRLEVLKERGLVTDDVAIYGIKTTEVFGREQPAVLAELQASEDWIELDTWIKEEREKILPADGFMQAIVDANEHREVVDFSAENRISFAGTFFQDYCSKADFIKAQHEAAAEYKTAVDDYRTLGGNVTDGGLTPTYDMDTEWTKILARYPMLSKFNKWDFKANWSHEPNDLAVEYVATIEELLAYRENSLLNVAKISA